MGGRALLRGEAGDGRAAGAMQAERGRGRRAHDDPLQLRKLVLLEVAGEVAAYDTVDVEEENRGNGHVTHAPNK